VIRFLYIENPVLYTGFFTLYQPFENQQILNDAEIMAIRRNIVIKSLFIPSGSPAVNLKKFNI
jgi:hypothetical protein